MTTETRVRDMYLDHPYPQWTKDERRRRLGAELARYTYLGLAPHMKGARLLDIGCGTGNRTMLPAKHYGVRQLVGLDGSRQSLAIAKQVAEDEEFDRFTPIEASLFEVPFADDSFDIVVSWGVLHHTSDPLRGFREMVRVCKPGGFVAIFLYNVFNHWRHNLQKARVSREAGDDVEQRFRVAHALYGTTPVDEMSAEDVAVFYDQYCHPHKSDHTLGETLGWFRDASLDFVGSYPPLRLRDFVSFLQFRSTVLRDFDFGRPMTRAFSRASLLLPNAQTAGTKEAFSSPTLAHRAFWQAIYAWEGRHGAYSGGAALSARKPV